MKSAKFQNASRSGEKFHNPGPYEKGVTTMGSAIQGREEGVQKATPGEVTPLGATPGDSPQKCFALGLSIFKNICRTTLEEGTPRVGKHSHVIFS